MIQLTKKFRAEHLIACFIIGHFNSYILAHIGRKAHAKGTHSSIELAFERLSHAFDYSS